MKTRAMFCLAAMGLVAGCSTFSWSSNKSVNGNSTGGIVPSTVKSDSEQVELANQHCAKYSKVVRITARPQDTGGRLIFVCEAPGTPPPPPDPSAKPVPAWHLPRAEELPPDAKTTKKQ
jgi:hypothetical protein